MPKLLIVDDDAVDREHVRRRLRGLAEWESREAEEGEEALRAIALDLPDIVLTDLRMPGMDGLELVRRLREEYPDLPVILMTSQGNERIAAEALRAGAAGYVAKAYLDEDLTDAVQGVLDLLEARRARGHVLRFLGRAEAHFDLENDPALIPPLAAYLRENLERLGFGDDAVRTQVGIALIEAMSNAMLHGNLELSSELRKENQGVWQGALARRRREEPFASRRLRCTVRESIAEVQYIIVDEGPGFDIASIPDPTSPENLLKPSGRGILLIRTFMDTVEYADGGTRLTMGKVNPSRVQETETS